MGVIVDVFCNAGLWVRCGDAEVNMARLGISTAPVRINKYIYIIELTWKYTMFESPHSKFRKLIILK